MQVFQMSCRNIQGDVPTNFQLPNVVQITSNSTYISPAGVDYLDVYAIGGGGGGAGGSSTSGANGGSGGGAGAVVFKRFAPGTYAIICGAGGAGGTVSNAGAAGGTTNFGSGLLVALGGGGGASSTGPSPRNGGAPGAIVSALYALASEPGGPGSSEIGGHGGSNYFGSGGSAVSIDADPTAGNPGEVFGGGGGGGLLAVGGSAGGAGGVIIIEHYA